MRVTFTARRLDAWRDRWPCSTLVTGTAYFDHRGDLEDLSGKLARPNVWERIDGHEFDAFVNDHQAPELAAIRGVR
jgi:hypothetical protein